MAWSCATRDDANKDNVCTPAISAGINRPPPSRPSRIYPECWDYETRLAIRDSFIGPGTPRECLFIYDGEVGLRIRSTAGGEASPLEGQQE